MSRNPIDALFDDPGEDDRYDSRHLPAHLYEAGMIDELRLVLGLEHLDESAAGATGRGTGQSVNSWFEQRETSGLTSEFLADLDLALALERRAIGERISHAETAPELGNELRFLLMQASVRGLARRLPAGLAVRLTETGLWSFARALDWFRRESDDCEKGELLAGLAPGLTCGQLRQAAELVRTLGDGEARDACRAAITAALGAAGRFDEALALVREMVAPLGRCRTLLDLGRQPGADRQTLDNEALTAALMVESPAERLVALVEVAELADSAPALAAVREAVGTAAGAVPEEMCPEALGRLAGLDSCPRVHHLLLRALGQISDRARRARELARFSRRLPDPLGAKTWCAALAALRALTRTHRRAVTMADLAWIRWRRPQEVELHWNPVDPGPSRGWLRPEENRWQALRSGEGLDQILQVAVDEIQAFSEMRERILHLVRLTGYLSPASASRALGYATEAAWRLHGEDLAVVLAELLPRLAPDAVREAMSTVRSLCHRDEDRDLVLASLAVRLARDGEVASALDLVLALDHPVCRLAGLEALAPSLSSSRLEQARNAAWEAHDHALRARLHNQWARQPERILDQSLELDHGQRLGELIALAERLEANDPLRARALEEALESARKTADPNLRRTFLLVLAEMFAPPRKAELLALAQQAGEEIRQTLGPAWLLATDPHLAPEQAEELRAEVEEAAGSPDPDQPPVAALEIETLWEEIRWGEAGPPATELQDRMLELARRIRSETLRALYLRKLVTAGVLAPERRHQALSEADSAMAEGRERQRRKLDFDWVMDHPLTDAVPGPAPLSPAASLSPAVDGGIEAEREPIAEDVEASLRRALRLEGSRRDRRLALLVPRLLKRDLADRAAAASRRIAAVPLRIWALMRLAEAREQSRQRAFKGALASRAEALGLSALAEVYRRPLAAMQGNPRRELEAKMTGVPRETLWQLWRGGLALLRLDDRGGLLRGLLDLTPLLELLGGREALDEATRAIADAGRWWK